jgi:hypothetical protein
MPENESKTNAARELFVTAVTFRRSGPWQLRRQSAPPQERQHQHDGDDAETGEQGEKVSHPEP